MLTFDMHACALSALIVLGSSRPCARIPFWDDRHLKRKLEGLGLGYIRLQVYQALTKFEHEIDEDVDLPLLGASVSPTSPNQSTCTRYDDSFIVHSWSTKDYDPMKEGSQSPLTILYYFVQR